MRQCAIIFVTVAPLVPREELAMLSGGTLFLTLLPCVRLDVWVVRELSVQIIYSVLLTVVFFFVFSFCSCFFTLRIVTI